MPGWIPRDLDRRLAGVTELPGGTANAIRTVDALLADLERVRDRGYSIDDEETMEGVVCFGVAIPGRQPGEGPNAASITLLKVRATDERVPLLVADLHRLADELVDPLHRLDTAGAGGLISARQPTPDRRRDRIRPEDAVLLGRRKPGPA